MIDQSAWDLVATPLLNGAGAGVVWLPGGEDIADALRTGATVTVTSDPGGARAAVLGAEPNHAAVSSALATCSGSATIALVIVFGVGWPHGDRDGFRRATPIRPTQERTPDPTTGSLGPERPGMRYALEAGGVDNGVASAVEQFAVAAGEAWRLVRIHGLGGVAVAIRGTPSDALRHELDAYATGSSSARIAQHLDRRLGAALVREAQLANALSVTEEQAAKATYTLAATLDELRAHNDDDEHRLSKVLPGALASIERRVGRGEQREHVLEGRLRAVEAQLAAVRSELLSERAWISEQMRRLIVSRSWRIGDGIVRGARRAAFRRDRGTNALGVVLKRIDPPQDPR